MTKIYSRWRIRLPNFKKVNKFRLYILLALVILIISVASFIYAAYPIFIESCKNSASSIAVEIISTEVNKIMKEYKYSDLIIVEKEEENEDIKLIQSNTIAINEVVTKITKKIQTEINNYPRTTIPIYLGEINNFKFLNNFTPQINIELETTGSVYSELLSKFESAGINQTLHRIYLQLQAKIVILTPICTIRRNYTSKCTAYRGDNSRGSTKYIL